MNINTVVTSFRHGLLALLLATCGAQPSAVAQTVLSGWTAIFRGVDHAVGTNAPGSGSTYPNLQVIHALRVDLQDPDIQLVTTPPIANNVIGSRETAAQTVSDFLLTQKAQVAVNAGTFRLPGSSSPPPYGLAKGSALVVDGLSISKGVLVSSQESAESSSSLLFTTNNQPSFIFTNWPQHSIAGVYNAISGMYPLVVNGSNIGSNYLSISDNLHTEPQPRTAFGLSQDKRYLYLLTIDGRQNNYSEGALDWETGAWLIKLGAYEAVNMDGGGSTTLAMQNSFGGSTVLNKSSAVAANGVERTVGSHLAIFAKPVPGLINDMLVNSDDTAATISWTTVAPSGSSVFYGTTTNVASSTSESSVLLTNHAVIINGLVPGVTYYYKIVSTVGSTQYTSPVSSFVTTNYAALNPLFDVTKEWKYTTASLDAINWTARDYDDSNWEGSGPGLLWADSRTSGLDAAVTPRNTRMATNPANSGYPFITYYFRTQFQLATVTPGTSLELSCMVDDGAVIYLNGTEVSRLRMPAPAFRNTLANGFPCSGNATCADLITLGGDAVTNLLVGNNILAVEVHNYNAQSPDITFGMAMSASTPVVMEPRLDYTSTTSGGITLKWNRGGFALEEASSLDGPWTKIQDPAPTSPYRISSSGQNKFYRLTK